MKEFTDHNFRDKDDYQWQIRIVDVDDKDIEGNKLFAINIYWNLDIEKYDADPIYHTLMSGIGEIPPSSYRVMLHYITYLNRVAIDWEAQNRGKTD